MPVAAEAEAEPKHAEPLREVEAAEPKRAEPLREARELLHEAQAVPQVRGSALIRGATLAIHWLLQELIPGFAQIWNSPPCVAWWTCHSCEGRHPDAEAAWHWLCH
jgi:hypothetical protein